MPAAEADPAVRTYMRAMLVLTDTVYLIADGHIKPPHDPNLGQPEFTRRIAVKPMIARPAQLQADHTTLNGIHKQNTDAFGTIDRAFKHQKANCRHSAFFRRPHHPQLRHRARRHDGRIVNLVENITFQLGRRHRAAKIESLHLVGIGIV